MRRQDGRASHISSSGPAEKEWGHKARPGINPTLSETDQDPVGLLDTQAFPCPPFLVCREQTPASMTFPEF